MSSSSKKRASDNQPLDTSIKVNFRAFTMKVDRPLYRVEFKVGIVANIPDHKGFLQSQLTQYVAILDTATERTRVSRKAIDAAKLEPIEDSGFEGYYLADIYLPNMIRFSGVTVTEIPPDLGFQADCLIGMDILSCADCSLSHKDKKMMFSFRVPPLGAMDFVEEHQRLYKGEKRMVTTAATRNQPCPCGSGKRFKNCCGKIH